MMSALMSSFRLSISGRCCLDGSSIHQPTFCCSSYSPQSSPPQCDHIILSILSLHLFLWHCTFPSSINFFHGWFRLHVRNNLFCLCDKVPDLTTAMDWFVVCRPLCSVHDTKHISPYNLFSKMYLCVSPCFCSGSTFQVHVAVENVHVHNALLHFCICCLPKFLHVYDFLNAIANLRMILFYLCQLLSMTQYILNYSPSLFLHKLL